MAKSYGISVIQKCYDSSQIDTCSTHCFEWCLNTNKEFLNLSTTWQNNDYNKFSKK